MKPIEKLPTGSTSKDGIWWERHPTPSDIAEKVDEIVDALNAMMKEMEARANYEMRKLR